MGTIPSPLPLLSQQKSCYSSLDGWMELAEVAELICSLSVWWITHCLCLHIISKARGKGGAGVRSRGVSKCVQRGDSHLGPTAVFLFFYSTAANTKYGFSPIPFILHIVCAYYSSDEHDLILWNKAVKLSHRLIVSDLSAGPISHEKKTTVFFVL